MFDDENKDKVKFERELINEHKFYFINSLEHYEQRQHCSMCQYNFQNHFYNPQTQSKHYRKIDILLDILFCFI